MKKTRKLYKSYYYITLPLIMWFLIIILSSFIRPDTINFQKLILFATGSIMITSYIYLSVYENMFSECKGFIKRVDKESKEIISGKRLKIFFRKKNSFDISMIKHQIEEPLENSIRLEKSFQQWNYTIDQINLKGDIKTLVNAEKAIRGAINNEKLCRFF